MSNYKIQTTLRLYPDVYEKVVAIAKAEHRSINAQLEFAIGENIKKYESEHGPIETK